MKKPRQKRSRPKSTDRTDWFIGNFPVDLRRRFVAAAKVEGRTTTDKMIELVTKALKAT